MILSTHMYGRAMKPAVPSWVQLRLKRARQSEQTILTCSGVPGRKRELALANPVGAASRLRLRRDKLGENTPIPP